jgi:hypothetical protein
VFELVTSKNRRRARNTDFGAAVTSTTRAEKSLKALTCVDGRMARTSEWPILDEACRIPA